MTKSLARALRLYWVMGPRDDGDMHALGTALRHGIAGGVTMVQWRDKRGVTSEQQVKVIRDICGECNVPFLVNDDVMLALNLGADGVHLGQEDMDPKEARALLGTKAIIGLSVGNEQEVARYDPQTVDYVGVGPLYPTITKQDAGDALGWQNAIDFIERQALSHAVLIGGISHRMLAQERKRNNNSNSPSSAHLTGFAVASALSHSTNVKQSAEFLSSEIDFLLKLSQK